MLDIYNKRILLFAPKFYNYEIEIQNVLIEKGAMVDTICCEPSPIFTTMSEVCSKFGISKDFFRNLFRKKLKKQIKGKYDIIIIIDGWLVNCELSRYLKSNCLNNNGNLVLYYWDSLNSNEMDFSRWQWFDKISTFDRFDYLKYKTQIQFLPLFYCDQFWDSNIDEKQYDLYIIGSFRLNRLEFVRNLINNNSLLKIGSYLYIPKWQIRFHRAFRKKYRHVKNSELKFSKLSMKEVQNYYKMSKAIIDIPAKDQKGLTIRTIEALAMHKKLITTNKDIINYDFYNPNDIYVCENEKQLILPDPDWFNTQFSIPNTTIIKYSIRNWINNLLSL